MSYCRYIIAFRKHLIMPISPLCAQNFKRSHLFSPRLSSSVVCVMFPYLILLVCFLSLLYIQAMFHRAPAFYELEYLPRVCTRVGDYPQLLSVVRKDVSIMI